MEQTFGGDWTRKKLDALKAYLDAYELIFTKNEAASHFIRIYLDAFAGTGSILLPQNTLDEKEGREFLQGSTSVALGLPTGFHQYIFIEKDIKYAKELDQLRTQFPDKKERMAILVEDANKFLHKWYKVDLPRYQDRNI